MPSLRLKRTRVAVLGFRCLPLPPPLVPSVSKHQSLATCALFLVHKDTFMLCQTIVVRENPSVASQRGLEPAACDTDRCRKTPLLKRKTPLLKTDTESQHVEHQGRHCILRGKHQIPRHRKITKQCTSAQFQQNFFRIWETQTSTTFILQ